MNAPTKLHRRPEASAHLKNKWNVDRSPATLAKLASTGGGPEFRRLNRAVFYEESALDAWVRSHMSPPLASTSDPGASE